MCEQFISWIIIFTGIVILEGAHVSDVDVNDDPPTYEPPPSYDEVMKKEKEKMLRNCEEFMW